VRREVFDDEAVQGLVNGGRAPGLAVTPDTLLVLLQAGRIQPALDAASLAWLKKLGVLTGHVALGGDGELDVKGRRITNRLDDAAVRTALYEAGGLGQRLAGGVVLHGGFFLGPTDFYEQLRRMPPDRLAKIDMTRIDFINQLHGQSTLKQAQRRKGRFMNTTMMVTLLGAAVSDGLESGQVVSGVGGQYNFVAMAHALPDARSILMLRATHEHKDGLRSTLVWNYAYDTIPRHLRDVVITEYGVADLRAQPDGEVVRRLIAIADSRFQDALVAQAKAAGKLDAGYTVPEQHRQNLPEVLRERLQPWLHQSGLLPDFPFGTDLSAGEIEDGDRAAADAGSHAAPGRAGRHGAQKPGQHPGGAARLPAAAGPGRRHQLQENAFAQAVCRQPLRGTNVTALPPFNATPPMTDARAQRDRGGARPARPAADFYANPYPVYAALREPSR
jgi:hypothetical protein